MSSSQSGSSSDSSSDSDDSNSESDDTEDEDNADQSNDTEDSEKSCGQNQRLKVSVCCRVCLVTPTLRKGMFPVWVCTGESS